jgi:Domain of unknown function (DUF4398)
MTSRLSLPVTAFLLATACASTNAPPSQTAESSSAAIRAAEEVGATHTPDAALHLQLAKEQFEHARLLTSDKDRAWADRLRLRAQADAELSLALARNENEKAAAAGAVAKVKTLKESANP